MFRPLDKIPVAKMHLNLGGGLRRVPKEFGVHDKLPLEELMGIDLGDWPDGTQSTLILPQSQSQ